jgi:hypothetical protein
MDGHLENIAYRAAFTTLRGSGSFAGQDVSPSAQGRREVKGRTMGDAGPPGGLRWAIAGAAVAALILAGCGSTVAPHENSQRIRVGVVGADPNPAASNAPTAWVPDDFRVQRRTWGGLRAGGPCGSTLTVTASGRWVLSSEGTTTTGTLSREQVIALTRAVRVTQLHRATGAPDCAAEHDGVSVAYEWTFAGVSGSASSCEHPINGNDSLPIEVERVAQAITS